MRRDILVAGDPMRRGYTLIETVVVLLVLALAAGIAAPAVGRGLDAIHVRTEVAGIASFLRAARAQAIAQRRSVEVRIERDGQTLVRASDAPGDAADRLVHHLSPRLHLTAEGPAGRPVTFFAHGLSSGARLRVESGDAALFVLTVDPLTGRVAARRSRS
jgi:general secretion pathway protein H